MILKGRELEPRSFLSGPLILMNVDFKSQLSRGFRSCQLVRFRVEQIDVCHGLLVISDGLIFRKPCIGGCLKYGAY